MKSLIRLFRAVYISTKKRKTANKDILSKCIKNGFIFSPEVIYNYDEDDLNKIISIVVKELCLSGKELNSSFHKSWNKVKDTSLEQLYLEQIVHYITTYGFESFGFYDKDLVYIPKEKLEIPDITESIQLINIRGYTKQEIKEKIFELIMSGIALHKDTIDDIINIIGDIGIDEKEIENIKNKEIKTALYKKFDLFPESPIEFLRYAIFLSINKTLLIKDKATIEAIKANDKFDSYSVFNKYRKKYGLEKLAQIFYRFKPIFLAFRSNKEVRPIINKIRKLAINNHIPMKQDFCNNVTVMASNNEIKYDDLKHELKNINIFRKIRLLYAINYRTIDVDSILYRIRNGKSFSTEFHCATATINKMKKVYDIVFGSIVSHINEKINKTKIYIPNNITYALPATEKQFSGNLPSGTCIEVFKDLVCGVNWHNVKNNRVDLDLSMMNADTKMGWDGNYRNSSSNILFSGDMTDASSKDGASELFYIQKQKLGIYLVTLNYFNHDEDLPVPYKLFVGEESLLHKNRLENYMVDGNNVKLINKSEIDKKQKILGIIKITTNSCKFYFAESYLGNSITISNKDYAQQARKYLVNYYTSMISLNKVLEQAGAILVNDKSKCDIDLSYENLEKDKIISLIK